MSPTPQPRRIQIPRIQSFEFEDLPWFPKLLREQMTDFLRMATRILWPLHRHIAERVLDALGDTESDEVVDLCSGSGGMLPDVLEVLRVKHARVLRPTFTDLYPNAPGLGALVQRIGRGARFVDAPIDATMVPADLMGLRTLFLGFHHFPPSLGRAILADAARARQPIALFEVTERRLLPLLLFTMAAPALVLGLAPFTRPFRVSRLLLTYVIPVLPFFCWYDGVISHLRTYTPPELIALTDDIDVGNYRWDAQQKRIGWLPVYCTSLIGTPV